jgi:hypothetical protein
MPVLALPGEDFSYPPALIHSHHQEDRTGCTTLQEVARGLSDGPPIDEMAVTCAGYARQGERSPLVPGIVLKGLYYSRKRS